MAPAARGPGRRPAGFTLLELVVAITLIGLILVVLYGGLRLGLNGTDSGEQRAEASNRLRLVQEFLRRQLAQSMTVYRTNDQRAAIERRINEHLGSGLVEEKSFTEEGTPPSS